MKRRWKRCPICKIYTDADERYCPRYGVKGGHELQLRELTELGAKRLYKKGKLLTKYVADMERRFSG